MHFNWVKIANLTNIWASNEEEAEIFLGRLFNNWCFCPPDDLNEMFNLLRLDIEDNYILTSLKYWVAKVLFFNKLDNEFEKYYRLFGGIEYGLFNLLLCDNWKDLLIFLEVDCEEYEDGAAILTEELKNNQQLTHDLAMIWKIPNNNEASQEKIIEFIVRRFAIKCGTWDREEILNLVNHTVRNQVLIESLTIGGFFDLFTKEDLKVVSAYYGFSPVGYDPNDLYTLFEHIIDCTMFIDKDKPFIFDMPTDIDTRYLEVHTVRQLKSMAKSLKIFGYERMNKQELVDSLCYALDIEERIDCNTVIDGAWPDIETYSMETLYQIARDLGLTNFSHLRKSTLIDYIESERQRQLDLRCNTIEPEIDQELFERYATNRPKTITINKSTQVRDFNKSEPPNEVGINTSVKTDVQSMLTYDFFKDDIQDELYQTYDVLNNTDLAKAIENDLDNFKDWIMGQNAPKLVRDTVEYICASKKQKMALKKSIEDARDSGRVTNPVRALTASEVATKSRDNRVKFITAETQRGENRNNPYVTHPEEGDYEDEFLVADARTAYPMQSIHRGGSRTAPTNLDENKKSWLMDNKEEHEELDRASKNYQNSVQQQLAQANRRSVERALQDEFDNQNASEQLRKRQENIDAAAMNERNKYTNTTLTMPENILTEIPRRITSSRKNSMSRSQVLNTTPVNTELPYNFGGEKTTDKFKNTELSYNFGGAKTTDNSEKIFKQPQIETVPLSSRQSSAGSQRLSATGSQRYSASQDKRNLLSIMGKNMYNQYEKSEGKFALIFNAAAKVVPDDGLDNLVMITIGEAIVDYGQVTDRITPLGDIIPKVVNKMKTVVGYREAFDAYKSMQEEQPTQDALEFIERLLKAPQTSTVISDKSAKPSAFRPITPTTKPSTILLGRPEPAKPQIASSTNSFASVESDINTYPSLIKEWQGDLIGPIKIIKDFIGPL